MTTETHGPWSTRRGATVLGPLACTGLVGLVLGAAALVFSGSAEALGASIGALTVCVFFAAGAAVLGVVARLAPSASLLIALLTYTLQVVALAVVFVGLSRSGAFDDAVARDWLGGTVIACTLVWLVAQIFFTTRVRQPLYDLPSESNSRPEEASAQ